MNVLLTGGAGFIGHHIIEYLLSNTDWNIISLDRLDFSGNLNRINEVVSENKDKTRVRVVHHDLRAAISPQISDIIGNASMEVEERLPLVSEWYMNNKIWLK